MASNKTIYGPALPTNVRDKQESEVEKVSESVDNQSYGLALPPHLQKSTYSQSNSMGPSLPQHSRDTLMNDTSGNHDEESSEEEGTYGPMLPGSEFKSKSAIALEERALQMKLNQLNPQEKKEEREEWMIELPTVSASKLGLGPRQFKPNAGPDMSDRSSWTDTPNNKKKKKSDSKDLKKEFERSEILKRDREQEKMAKKHKREQQSLVELHRKKLKKEKVEGSKERVPFNRETDLQVNKFDEAQKAAVLKKAQLLDDRFSKGTSKYL